MLNLKNTLDGYLKNVEIIGNTIQDTNNLADIRSVGNKVEGQELYNISIQVDNGAGVSEVVEILSPVQLEKVGDVADRIVCKDGVWGVEKNIVTKVLNGNDGAWQLTNNSEYLRFGNYNICNDAYFTVHSGKPIISDKFITGVNTGGETTQEQIMYYCHGDSNIELRISILASKVGSTNFNDWLKDNNVTIKYRLAQPQFIPLPHDQQVKLRTFAGQTNIAFLTEIPGQIKAQVPKSLGATVNTHTEQIADLHNSLDRVKKLEETTVSTVETGSSFTTVDATSNGYFEDVKLEGKTLVNLASMTGAYIRKDTGNVLANDVVPLLQGLKANTTYTRIINVSKVNLGTVNSIKMYDALTDVNGVYKQYSWSYITTPGVYMDTFTVSDADTTPTYSINPDARAFNGTTGAELEIDKMVILEGDHTNNPPGYYKGLMSVGQDVKEVSVSSCDENYMGLEQGSMNTITGNFVESETRVRSTLIPYNSRTDVSIDFSKFKVLFIEYDYNRNFMPSDGIWGNSNRTLSNQCKYYKVIIAKPDDSKITVNEVKDGKSNKKPLLYYNPTTETWEKPVLREWDSIEKHSDGKYYYHKRSEEVVLDGSESWSGLNTSSELFNRMYISLPGKAYGVDNFVADNFIFKTDNVANISGGGFAWGNINNDTLWFTFSKTLDSKSKWIDHLQANPTTVVYQLAKEEVYECTNIDLMTYSGETNYIINSGVISPKSLLKVHNNISNVVKILQEKVSLLENTFIAGLKSVLSGDMYSLATILYPEDFEQNDNTEQDIMVIPE